MTSHYYSVFTVRELSRVTGVSESTIRRNKDKLLKCGAFCGRPAWRITLEQAYKAGLIGDYSCDYSCDQSSGGSAVSVEAELREQIVVLANALEREKSRVEFLEKILEQEKNEKLLWLQGYLSETRQIELKQNSVETPPEQEVQPHKRGWFARLFG